MTQLDVDSAVTYNNGRPYTSHHWCAIQTKVGTTADGVPGPNTATAIAAWQGENDLIPDGKCGPQTLIALGLDYVLGIDVSHHKGAIDWALVAAAGYRYAWTKATQGESFVDSRLVENARGAADVGMLVGYYHFADTAGDNGRGDVLTQLDHFLMTIEELPVPQLPLVLDVEKETPLSRVDYTAWCETFMAGIAGWSQGRRAQNGAMVYTSRRIVDRDLSGDHQLGSYPLWAPRYGSSAPDTPVDWDYWLVWQHTATGQVPGVGGDCDVNRADPVWFSTL